MIEIPRINFDFKNPDYTEVLHDRANRLELLQKDYSLLPALKVFYADNPAHFINDWGMTMDPRVVLKRSALMPFLLFPKQFEMIDWMMERFGKGEDGIVEKSREVGASWIAMALGVTMCLFHKNMHVGIGSAKEMKLDRLGDMDTLFMKARSFLQHIPQPFLGDFDLEKHAPYLRIVFPSTGSTITGEAGDGIGRGGRKAMYIVDESAHIERAELIDHSLASNTDCRIDISSVKGMANPFAVKRFGGKLPVFTFHWRDDPRKDEEWRKKLDARFDPTTIKQEFELDYMASVEGVVIHAEWVHAAVDAHLKLNVPLTGRRRASFDVADKGRDKCAFAVSQGVLLEHAEDWSGSLSDIMESLEKVFLLCDEHKVYEVDYDCEGMGASIDGMARVINSRRKLEKLKQVKFSPYRGSAAVTFPERLVKKTERKAKDFFLNHKAESWWALRCLFEDTYHAVVDNTPFEPGDIISIASGFKDLSRVQIELGQAVYKLNASGKLLIDKTPDDVASPNLADCVVINHAPRKAAMVISSALLQTMQHAPQNPSPLARHY